MNSAYGDLLLRTEVRWFSRGTCLIRVYALRSEERDFLSEHVPNPIELKNQLENADFLRNGFSHSYHPTSKCSKFAVSG
jgi:hypothetical protein